MELLEFHEKKNQTTPSDFKAKSSQSLTVIISRVLTSKLVHHSRQGDYGCTNHMR